MTGTWHPLIPFGASGPEGITVEAQASVLHPGPLLRLRYRVRGAESLLLPESAAVAERRDGLWEHTCLEAFLAPGLTTARPGAEDAAEEPRGYWEFNMAPSGHWNVYRLEDYRDGLKPESFYGNLPLTISLGKRHRHAEGRSHADGHSDAEGHSNSAEADTLELLLCCPLPPPLATAPELQLGLTAVIETRSGEISYWALHHPGGEADFHHRDGWTLRL
jgi:hypothetical protein